MPICELCGEEVDYVIRCKRCGRSFCDLCGSMIDKLCYDCLEEEESIEEDWEEE